MEQLTGRRPSRAKAGAYSSMIRELLQEVEKLTHENERLTKQLVSAQASQKEQSEKIAVLTQERDALQKACKDHQEQTSNESIGTALEMANREAHINKLTQENLNLNEQINAFKRERNADRTSQQAELAAMNKQMGLLQLAIEQHEEEKRLMAREREDKDRFHQLEVEELRKINAIIKKNFQTMEQDYNALIAIAEEQPLTSRRLHPAKPSKEVTLKKLRLLPTSNPEMEEELWRIKQQVSEQMAKINSSHNQVVKGRVDRTLATIESLLSEMSHRVDPSDEDSES